MSAAKFPVGGEREPVYAFLRQHGYVMDRASDKQWFHHEGRVLHLYGAGSQARITETMSGRLLADGPLADAVSKTEAA